jgi:sugar/nucleoside kinase (ribokinase family)
LTLGVCNGRETLHAPVISVDLNGVQPGCDEGILTPALPLTDLLHLNHEEAEVVTGVPLPGCEDRVALRKMAGKLHDQGVAVVAVTLGDKGAFVSVTPQPARVAESEALARQVRGSLTVARVLRQ